MPHLVSSIAKPVQICEAEKRVRAAHAFLVEAAKASVKDHRRHPANCWGQLTKRDKVVFESATRPDLIDGEIDDHSFAEIVNQCATMERLLDALTWAQGEFAGWVVTTCHSTTSSARGKEHDHDLVLAGLDGAQAHFEVSDVASRKDGNGKELKDVRLLLPELGAASQGTEADTAEARRFLVVSEEFGRRLQGTSSQSRYRNVQFHYTRMPTSGTTAIFEVHLGPPPDELS